MTSPKVEGGRFYRKDAEHHLPIYLDADNLQFMTELVERLKSAISEVVNDLFRPDKDLARVLE